MKSKLASKKSRSNSRRVPQHDSSFGESDRSGAVSLLMDLLAVPGASGDETAISALVQRTLLKAGAKRQNLVTDQAHRRSPHPGDIGNLVLDLPGTLRGPRRLLMAHLDTVPICVGCRPVHRGNRIHSKDPHTGLGADNRAGCGVLLAIARKLLVEAIPHPPLTLVWTVQEEVGLQGARLLKLGLLKKPRYAFNWDGGSAAKLTIGATGGYRMEIQIRGKASHAGNCPERGVSAIAVASLAVADLHDRGWHGAVSKKGRLGTSNVGVIQGGAATNVVADNVRVLVEARSHDARFRERIVSEIERAFRNAARKVTSIDGKRADVRIQGRLDYEAFCLPTDHACVTAARSAVQAVGRHPELAVANGGLDANWLTARGVPTVSFGCGQQGQHTVDESLDLREFHSACQIAFHLATRSLDSNEA